MSKMILVYLVIHLSTDHVSFNPSFGVCCQ